MALGQPVQGQPGLKLRTTYLAEIVNESRRPIRNVTARIQPNRDDGLHPPVKVGRYGQFGMPPRRSLLGLSPVTKIALSVRAGEAAGLVFDVEVTQHPNARMKVRFTDDAGLHWQVNHDHDLHLEQLADRDDW